MMVEMLSLRRHPRRRPTAPAGPQRVGAAAAVVLSCALAAACSATDGSEPRPGGSETSKGAVATTAGAETSTGEAPVSERLVEAAAARARVAARAAAKREA